MKLIANSSTFLVLSWAQQQSSSGVANKRTRRQNKTVANRGEWKSEWNVAKFGLRLRIYRSWTTRFWVLLNRLCQEKLTRARLRSSSWAALTFSFLPPHALNTEACKARPYENVRAHGRLGWLLMAFKLTEASSSDWPPDKKVTPGKRHCEKSSRNVSFYLSRVDLPGTAAGTVRRKAVTVASAICSAVGRVPLYPIPAVHMFGFNKVPSK